MTTGHQPIPSLTGLRFVAAMCVVISHAIPKLAPFSNPPDFLNALSAMSGVGMSLFFVLSGFVIYYNYADVIRSPGGLYNFFVARFARLYPLYFLCLIYDLLHSLTPSNLSAVPAALPYFLTLTQSWFYIPVGDHALTYQFGRIAQVSWSISTEWFFYLLFPFGCLALSRLTTVHKTMWATAAFVFMAIVVTATLTANKGHLFQYGLATFGPVGADPQNSFYRWLMYFSPYIRSLEFLLGCLCAAIYTKLKIPTEREQRFGAWLTVGTLGCLGALQWAMFGISNSGPAHEWLIGMHMSFGFAPLIAVLIFCCARYRNPIVNGLSRPMIVLCGEASYSIYLLHLIVIDGFQFSGFVRPELNHILIAACRVGVVAAATVGLALITWILIEVPSRRWIRRVLGSHAAVSPAAARST